MRKICSNKYCKAFFEPKEGYEQTMCPRCFRDADKVMWTDKKYEDDKKPEGIEETYIMRTRNLSSDQRMF
jgi:hypothetical protein